jgi:DNA polymerase
MKVHIDIETYSEADLKKEGLYRHANDYSTELLVVCYAIDDGPVMTWWPVPDVPAALRVPPAHVGEQAPADLLAALEAGATVYAHNASFERAVLSGHVGRRHGFPVLRPSRMVCTAAKAAAHGLPRSLEDACKAIGTRPKMASGRANMLQLAKPRTGKQHRYEMADYPEKYADLAAYCVDDVRAERDLDRRLPDLTPREQAVWELDQLINDRGVRLDRKAIADVQFLIAEYKAELKKLCIEWTGCNPTQTAEIANWVRKHGYPQLVDLQKASVDVALQDEACPENVRQVLRLRSTYAMAAVAKYTAMETSVGDDDRLRGMLLYHGAATGRWASLLVQLQNMFRPVIKDVPTAIEAFALRDLQWVKDLYPADPMKVFASAVRGMIIPAEGKDLMALDFSAIEARVLAWLAGQRDILAVFATHGKVYEYTAGQIYRVPLEKVTEAQRFIGKVAVLALGYQGGQAAFAKMAKNFGVDIPEERANEIKNDWRKANNFIVQFWYDIETAAKAAVGNPGQAFGVPSKRIVFCVKDRWLVMRLPSGRKLYYLDPEIDENGQVTYMGVDTYTRRWCRVGTYGGKLCLAGDTEVLTDKGWLPISQYREGARLWDGAAWVYGGKLLDQGVKPVIRYAGVWMTSDHEVLSNEGWKTAEAMASGQGLERAQVRLPDCSPVLSQRAWQDVLGSAVRVRERDGGRGGRIDSSPRPFTEVMWVQDRRVDCRGQHATRPVQAPGVLGVSKHDRPLSAAVSSGMAQLWRQGYTGLRTLAERLCVLLGRHGARISARAVLGAGEQREGVFARELSVGYVQGAGQQYAHEPKDKYPLGADDGHSSRQKGRASEYNDPRKDQKRLAGEQTARTYDIANVGPRNRFTVRGDAGEVFIVHNCENSVQAIARDLLVNGMFELEAAGYPLVLTVHDEVVMEVDSGDLDEAAALMCRLPEWAKGLPVKAEGWVGVRYRK